MYKKAPHGIVAQQFTIADLTPQVGNLAILSGDLTVAATGTGPCIGEIAAIDKAMLKATVELRGSKIMDVTAGAGGLAYGTRAKISGAANTAITDAAGDLLVLAGATVGNTATVMFY